MCRARHQRAVFRLRPREAKPPLMGCYATPNACAQGDLRPAKRSSNIEAANVLLAWPPSSLSLSSSSPAPTSTAAPSSTITAPPPPASNPGMQPEAVVKLVLVVAAAVLGIARLIFWMVRRRRAGAPARHIYPLLGIVSGSQCPRPPASVWTLESRSPAGETTPSYVPLHPGGVGAGASGHSIPPEHGSVAAHNAPPTELPGSATAAVFELQEENSLPLGCLGFAAC